MKKVFFIILISLIFNSFADKIKLVTINDEEVKFRVSENQAQLEMDYIKLVEMYAAAENELHRLKVTSAEYMNSTNSLIDNYKKNIADKETLINEYEKQTVLLKKASIGYKWYWGADVLYYTNGLAHVIGVAPKISYVNSKYGFLLNIGPSVNFETGDLTRILFGFSAGFQYHF